eukprot:1610958-Rhodomonas_salina.2
MGTARYCNGVICTADGHGTTARYRDVAICADDGYGATREHRPPHAVRGPAPPAPRQAQGAHASGHQRAGASDLKFPREN